MNFNELIYPMTRKTFYEQVKGKRYHVWKSKDNRFKDLIKNHNLNKIIFHNSKNIKESEYNRKVFGVIEL